MNMLNCTIFWSVTPCILADVSGEIKPSKQALHCDVLPSQVTSHHLQRVEPPKFPLRTEFNSLVILKVKLKVSCTSILIF
jgi:hypothetical protein